jgi:1,4-dihydroxy-2-naphthoate octaprenyltransferase
MRTYARLAKLDVFDYYLAVPMVWTLLPSADRLAGRVVASLLAFQVGTVGVLAAGVALDDVTGHRDGSDAANYGPDAPARRLVRKPLLTGALTTAEAIRFAGWCAAGGGAAWTLSIAVAPHRPGWAIGIAAVCLLISVQYSYGLKLSYHGGQELILIGFGSGIVLTEVGLTGGRLAGLAAVEALLFGLGPLLFGVYSNTNDVAGDAAARRHTAAALLSRRANTVLIAALSAVEPAVVLLAAAVGATPRWFPLALAPTAALRARQLIVGLSRGDILTARRLGIRAHRTTVAALVVVNLLAGGAS